MNLPKKQTRFWIFFAVISFIITLASFILSRIILSQEIQLQAIIGFSIISVFVLILVLLGYIGARYFSATIGLGNILACLYMLFIVITTKDGGWADLTSFAGFVTIMFAAFAIGIMIQLGILIWGKVKK
jgi:hypothetical protein